MSKEILCTLGPASLNEYVINRLSEIGVSLFRINLSHTDIQDLEQVITVIRSYTDVPICLDSEGAQIRTGKFCEGYAEVSDFDLINIVREQVEGTAKYFSLYPLSVFDMIHVGDLISIDFNSVLVQVINKSDDCIAVRVLHGGRIGSNKAVSLDRDIALPPLTDKDRAAFTLGRRMGVKHVALSFANHPSDVAMIRANISADTYLISKIESISALKNLEAIADLSDAVLLDRGDMSRQVNIEQIAWVQKDVIRRARTRNCAVYVATNLLESMISISTPTRAEVNDIFNTLNDGADGLVLAAETAVGQYPVHCAQMVSRVIEQFELFNQNKSVMDYIDHVMISGLITPHGGQLISQCAVYDQERLNGIPQLAVDIEVLLDAEQIATGAFSPLTGFMGPQELDSVLDQYKLLSGEIWSLPVLLQTNNAAVLSFRQGQEIALSLIQNGEIYSILKVDEVYELSLDDVALRTYGSISLEHPGVQKFKERGRFCIAGKVSLIKPFESFEIPYAATPRQTRTIFKNKGWTKVVGFHTRNVAHRAHEYIQSAALNQSYCDGLFIQPVIGPKRKGDYSAAAVLASYEVLVKHYFAENTVVLGALKSYSRFAGPREAVFTAIVRKNYGCSHFIVGRDHTGVGKFYGPMDAKLLFEQLGDLGIIPVFFDSVYYCESCGTYVMSCYCKRDSAKQISGSDSRQMLQAMTKPPFWMMRDEISSLLVDHLKDGKDVFIQ